MNNPSTAEAVLFWVLAVVMVAAACGLLFARKAVHAAMSIVLVMICLAFLYVAQDAPFLGVVQVVVYTGAVMMLFLFVLMLVGVDASDSLVETIKAQRWVGWIAGIGLAVILIGVLVRATYPEVAGLDEANAPGQPDRRRPDHLRRARLRAGGGRRPAGDRRARCPGAHPPHPAEEAGQAAGAPGAADEGRHPDHPAARPRRLRPAQRDGRAGPRPAGQPDRGLGAPGAADPRPGGRHHQLPRRHLPACGDRGRRPARGDRR
ncbi:NADH-quinone oxidoreductase subunit J [Cellulomonas denverensis]|uniref:NADH-quinone oxidoreductase subunit J n=1 Tax=Cellulomonas denverensis TaxID=264297 RepID=UPI0035EC58BB